MKKRIWTTVGIIFGTLMLLSAVYLKRQRPDIPVQAAGPPGIPVGPDAYLMWDRLPDQRIGERAYMISTYMREGGNRAADSRNFLRMGQGEEMNYTLDVEGSGVLYFVRTNHWHGSPWHYIVDGNDHVVRETGTADPEQAGKTITHAVFIPEKAFPEPLAYTWTTTKGADLSWVPVGFERSLQLAYSHTFYGTGYYIFKRYANDEYLSQPIRSWDPGQTPGREVLDLMNRAGSDIAPQGISKVQGRIRLDQSRKTIEEIKGSGPSGIRAFRITLPLEAAVDLENIRLQVTWDDRPAPSIDAPLAMFFGAGTLYNRDRKEYLVKAFPVNIRFDYKRNRIELGCYFHMPFFKSARFELAGIDPGDITIGYEIRYEPYGRVPAWSSYFHATYRDFPDPEPGCDLTLLDTRGTEGSRDWSGNFVGTTYIFTHRNFLPTLEGDPRFFFDGARSPQAHGTGSEEWGGGGDYWGGETMTLPLAGHPVGAPRDTDPADIKDPRDMIHSAYRFLIADAMPFGNRAVIRLEHGGWNVSGEHYETVTYWYGLPAASLVKTDELDIGKAGNEKYHHYESPDAPAVDKVTSRFDGLGIDTFPEEAWELTDEQKEGYQRYAGAEIFPAHQEDGRHTAGTSEFSMHLDPGNYGVLLRRTLDYSFPNQKAEVYVADASREFAPKDPHWEYAGIWYTSGSSTYVFSPAEGEQGTRKYEVQTSPRRFRDDEFLIPAGLTSNRSAIRIRIVFIPVDRELYPGYPFPGEGAWSELRYEIFSYVMPAFME